MRPQEYFRKFSSSGPYILTAIGIILISLSFVAQRIRLSSDTSETIGQVNFHSGQILLKSPRLAPINVTYNAFLHSGEGLQTLEDSVVSFEVESGHKILVTPQTEIFFEKLSHEVIITVLQGEIEFEEMGRGSLIVSANGHRWHPIDYVESKENSKKNLLIGKSNQNKKLNSESDLSEELLSKQGKNIQAELQAQKGAFFRCYSNLLQKMPGVTGQVVLQVTLEKVGRPAKAEIVANPLRDSEFQNCLIDVLQRAPFKHEGEDPITVKFPLQFE